MAGVNLIKRLVQLGLLDSKNVDNARQVKSATTRYENIKKENSVFAKREKLAAKNNFDTVIKEEEFPKNIITPEDLQGEILIPLMGDPSNIGVLSQVGGIPVKSNVQGGSKFPSKWDDLAWASQAGSAGNYVNKVRHVEDTFGQAPISVNTVMTDASMYSPKFVRDPVFQQLDISPKLLKKDVLEFDERVRNEGSVDLSDWPGLFNGGIEMLDNLPMIKRGKVLEIMSMPKFRNKGFPLVQETINAARDPRFAGSSLGDSGAAIVRVDPSRDVIPLPDRIHENYDAGILKVPGSPVQQFERLIPYRTAFKDLFAEKAVAIDKNGRPLSVPNIIGSGNLSKEGIQRADQKWVDENMAFLERMKGNPKGLLAAGGGVVAPPTAGLLNQDFQGDPLVGMDLSQVKGDQRPFFPTVGEMGKFAASGIPHGILDTFEGYQDLAGTNDQSIVPYRIPDHGYTSVSQIIDDLMPSVKRNRLSKEEAEKSKSFGRNVSSFISGLLN
jgi:hypothetical protein